VFFADRNAQNTFLRLLELGIVPVVNENDTVSVDELRFGDNDTLSALVASLITADWLFLLTDVEVCNQSLAFMWFEC
jgi:glutamate 5-kinase